MSHTTSDYDNDCWAPKFVAGPPELVQWGGPHITISGPLTVKHNERSTQQAFFQHENNNKDVSHVIDELNNASMQWRPVLWFKYMITANKNNKIK